MKFSVGYQLPGEEGERFADIVRDYAQHIAEVYFPWADQPSGRAALNVRRGYVDWKAQQDMETELCEIRRMGIGLNLLFNSNCYGGMALSEHLEHQVASVVEHVAETCGSLDSVTTTSLAVANTLKRHFPKVKVRASVNMRIGTEHAMEYVAHLFDEYCIQRELNRDIAEIRELRRWADGNGKKLSILANSGCLSHCSGQTFHDNLVAHEQEIDETRNTAGWSPILCQHFLKDRRNLVHILRGTWIRPEDMGRYEGIMELVKLATRMHPRPRMVIAAYSNRRYSGNLLDLLEPGHSAAFADLWIDNDAFPPDWFEHSSERSRLHGACPRCDEIFKEVLKESGQED
jgi:collagenase-like PrtC family protease